MSDKLEEARIALEVAACEYAETGRAKPGTAKMLQAARDFAAAEMEEGSYRHPVVLGIDRPTRLLWAWIKWLRAGGLANEVGDE